MSITSQFNFIEFEKTWRSNLKEANTLFLSYLLLNVTELVINSTKRDKGYDQDLKDIIKYFAEYLRNQTFVLTRIIMRLDESVIRDLVALVDQDLFEQKKINPLMQRIDSILKDDDFIKIIRSMFLNDEIKDDEYHLVVGNLLRTLLLTHSENELTNLPSNVIKGHLISEKFSKFKSTNLDDELTSSNIQKLIIKIEKKVNHDLIIIKRNNNYQEYISKNILCQLIWIKTCESIYEMIISQINHEDGLEKLNENSIKNLTRSIIKKVIHVIINTVTENQRHLRSDEIFKDIEYISNKINNLTHISKTQIDIALFDGVLSSYIECVWDNIVSHLDERIDLETELFINFYKSQSINEKGNLRKFQFYIGCINHLKGLLERIFDITLEKFPLEFGKKTNSKFISYLVDRLPNYLSRYGNYKDLDRNATIKRQDIFITNLFDRLLEQERSMEVFFEIGNIDMKDEYKEIKSNILIYDPRKWHLGETFRMDWIEDSEKDIEGSPFFSEYQEYYFVKSKSNANSGFYLKRNSCRIRVSVKATDYKKAIEKGLREVLNTVSMISFLLSKTNTNFRPQILNTCFVRSADTNEGRYYSEIVVHRTANKFEYKPEYWKILDNIVTFMSKSSLNYEIQESIALFRMGYSNPNIHLRFSTYWTALEQLVKPFTQNDKDVDVISHLSITWRHSHLNLFLSSYLKTIISKIKGNSELTSKLNEEMKNWDKFDFILLENVFKIRSMTVDTKVIESIDNYNNWLNKIDKRSDDPVAMITAKESIVNEIIIMKVMQKFKIFIVDSKRNQIFHEGYKPIDGLIHITNFLEELLFEMIVRFLEMENIQRTNRLNGIIMQLNRPFKDQKFYLPIRFSNIIYEDRAVNDSNSEIPK